uniref:Uncharacterized protein n=1 Tax=Anguilla anguilla TaxID=7936 RepID=A0A0E9R2J6_ANGAN
MHQRAFKAERKNRCFPKTHTCKPAVVNAQKFQRICY